MFPEVSRSPDDQDFLLHELLTMHTGGAECQEVEQDGFDPAPSTMSRYHPAFPEYAGPMSRVPVQDVGKALELSTRCSDWFLPESSSAIS